MELEDEICVCGHSAGHHFLAHLSWKRGKQTTNWCEYQNQDGDCNCEAFLKDKDLDR